MSHKALLIIDYTNDFVADKGALTCGKPGQVLLPNLLKLADQYLQNGDWVILPTDVHVPNDPYHPETKLFPPHNVRGTWGRKFYGDLQSWYEQHRNNSKVKMMDKTRYDAFTGTDLDLYLRARHIDTIELTGVCTDICVLHTAIGGYNLGYQLIIPQNGVATITDEGQKWALGHFEHVLGAEVIYK